MILDKRLRRGDEATRRRGDETQAVASSRHRILPSQLNRFSMRPRWVRLVLLILAVCVLAAVGATIGGGFATGAAVVSQALGPTIAAAPTSIPAAPTSLPTAQPALIAAVATVVPSASEARWPVLAEEHFDTVSERWPALESTTWSSSYQDGGYMMQVDSRPGISYSGPLRAHDFWLSVDLKITRGQAGLFFLIGRPNDFYRFLIDTDGRYQLEWQQVGASQPLIVWTSSAALHRGAGEINQLAVRRAGDLLTLYANGQLLTTYALPPGNALESRIGLALDAPDDGRNGQAWFDNLLVRAPR